MLMAGLDVLMLVDHGRYKIDPIEAVNEILTFLFPQPFYSEA